jgi:RecA/RadA recombinase
MTALSTGSTLLNLALAEDPHGGLLRGKYFFFVGDSASGKTFLVITCLAEAVQNPRYRRYRLIYDNIEDGCLLDLERLFGKRTSERIEPPAKGKDGEAVYSSTVEEFYFHVDDAIKQGKPFIYVLDSMDALTSDPSDEKFEEKKKAHRAGKTTAGSYGDGKAKINSEGLRKVLAGVRDTRSILIILSQTRDNLGFGFEKKTRSGGRALRFYATAEIWSSIVKRIKRTVGGKDRELGVRVCLDVKKNRITGKLSKVEVDIYPSYGIDDLGSLVDYLVDEGVWKKSGKNVTAIGLGVSGTRDKLIQELEEKGLQDKVRDIAGVCWRRIQEACALKRKRRYE